MECWGRTSWSNRSLPIVRARYIANTPQVRLHFYSPWREIDKTFEWINAYKQQATSAFLGAGDHGVRQAGFSRAKKLAPKQKCRWGPCAVNICLMRRWLLITFS